MDAIRRTLTDEEYREQYLCEFLDESYAFMPYDLIRACVDADAEIERGLRSDPDADMFYGYDVARSSQGDNAVLAGVAVVGGKRHVRVMSAVRGESFDEQLRLVGAHADRKTTRAVVVDATGMGRMPAEQLGAAHYNVTGVDFTNKLKAELAQRMKIAFERREILIPDDDDLIADIHSIRKSYTGSNNVAYDAPRTAAGHGDRFWALALAIRASAQAGYDFVFI